MNSISIDDVKKLAVLSAITLDDAEAEAMRADLDRILDHVEQLQSVDTESVPPTYQAHDLETVTRPDELIDYGISRDDLLSTAPKHEDASLVVPRVIE